MRYYRSMPTKTKEYSLYDPGCLVVCKTDIYSSVAIDGDGGGTNRVVPSDGGDAEAPVPNVDVDMEGSPD